MTVRHCKRSGCHHMFISARHKLYCSTECRRYTSNRRHFPAKQVNCRVCRRTMTVEGLAAQKRLCSNECRRINHTLRHRGVKGIGPAIRLMLNLEHCQACGNAFNENVQMARRNIDHDHDTGYFRGIICSKCNLVEGLMDAEALRRLADYMQSRTPAGELTGYIRVEPNSETPATRQHG